MSGPTVSIYWLLSDALILTHWWMPSRCQNVDFSFCPSDVVSKFILLHLPLSYVAYVPTDSMKLFDVQCSSSEHWLTNIKHTAWSLLVSQGQYLRGGSAARFFPLPLSAMDWCD